MNIKFIKEIEISLSESDIFYPNSSCYLSERATKIDVGNLFIDHHMLRIDLRNETLILNVREETRIKMAHR